MVRGGNRHGRKLGDSGRIAVFSSFQKTNLDAVLKAVELPASIASLNAGLSTIVSAFRSKRKGGEVRVEVQRQRSTYFRLDGSEKPLLTGEYSSILSFLCVVGVKDLEERRKFEQNCWLLAHAASYLQKETLIEKKKKKLIAVSEFLAFRFPAARPLLPVLTLTPTLQT